MTYHPVVGSIIGLLKEHNFDFDTFEHEPVRTSEEAAQVRTGYSLSQGTKALIVKVKDREKVSKFAMLVVPGDKRFDIHKVKKNLGFSDIRFATETEVGELTGGVLSGGVPPFGNLFNLEVFADEKVFENERIIFNAGDRSYSVGMRSVDYCSVVSPRVVQISE